MARQPRSQQIDYAAYDVYHVVSRCTRQLHLLGTCDESRKTRKGLLLRELERLASGTAVGVAGFAVMDNHVHLLLKVDIRGARRWSPRTVARRWLTLHPPRNGYFQRVEVEDEHIDALAADPEQIEDCREKLMSISQFMKELKQEVAQKINREEVTAGPLWAGRFKCKAVTHEAQLLATMAYIDLNPFAAGVVDRPEAGQHTTLDARLGGVETAEDPQPETAPQAEPAGVTDTPSPPRQVARSRRPGFPGLPGRLGLPGRPVREVMGWWMSIEPVGGSARGKKRCLFPDAGLTLAAYLRFLDATGRLLRRGKRRLSNDADPITDRLHASPRAVVENYLRPWFEQGLQWAQVPTANPWG